jgi:ectoine hydroxylase-related dioxygenase (phytanoyl-CoA dioxygenase family)
MKLTPEQVRFFRHNGFLKLPGRLPEEAEGPLPTVARLKETVWRHIREEIAPVMRDRDGRVIRISDIWNREPLFRDAVTCPAVLDPLESLLGPNIELILNRHNHAYLRLAGDGADYLHRDILQWTRSIVTVIFYLEETTLENGCTRVIPGTHLLPGISSNRLEQDEALRQSGLLEQVVPVPMPAGGMLAIDSLVIHGPGRNHTDSTRMSLTVGYHSVDELSDVPNPKRVLVRGERPYMGNDGVRG